MSTAGRPERSSADDIATQLRGAGFVRLVAAADGGSVATAGVLATVLDVEGIPYQLSVTPHSESAERSTDADLTVAIGRTVAGADCTIGLDSVGARTAHSIAAQFGADNLTLALAGAVAADGHPGDELSTAAMEAGIERRPGVGIPIADLADGLAHSTLVHTPVSGDREAAESLLAELDIGENPTEEDRRRLASHVAVTVAGDPDGTERSAHCVEGFLRPLAGGLFQTIAGYADVLDALACEQPGLAVSAALGSVDSEQALDIWRAHAREAHETVRELRTQRYDGLFVGRCDGKPPVRTVSRLVADFRSPEPVVLVVGDGVAAASAIDETATVGKALEQTANEFDGVGGGTPMQGYARFDGEPADFVAAFKEEL